MKNEIAIILVFFAASLYAGGVAHLGVKVVDSETGQPIPKIKVYGGFKNYPKGWGIGAKNNFDEEVTDSDGFCRLSGRTEAGHASCIVRRNEGYYNSGWYSFDYEKRSALKFGRWIPDDTIITVRLDRVVNPIPLCVKLDQKKYRNADVLNYTVWKNRQGLSATNNIQIIKDVSFSFDMIKGEWLPPHGNGENEDIRFTFNETVLGWEKGRGYDGTYMTKKYKVEAAILLPGEGNGVIEMPSSEGVGIKIRTAPSNGYSNNILRWKGWFGGGDGIKTDCDKNRNYAFRIRTKYDASGNIESAYYGKIYGDFNIKDLEGVEFLYYLNPTSNDRNLEWDMKNNLCPTQERIHNPQP